MRWRIALSTNLGSLCLSPCFPLPYLIIHRFGSLIRGLSQFFYFLSTDPFFRIRTNDEDTLRLWTSPLLGILKHSRLVPISHTPYVHAYVLIFGLKRFLSSYHCNEWLLELNQGGR